MSLKNQTVHQEEINIDEDSKYIENLLEEPLPEFHWEELKWNHDQAPNRRGKIKPSKINMEEFYKKDIDELLDDSNWDVNSFQSDSLRHSLAESDRKVRGLE